MHGRATTVLAVLVCASFAATGAAQTVYSWTDERGVVHFSDSTAPPRNSTGGRAIPARRGVPRPTPVERSRAIPLVTLEGDTTKKFVSVTVEGPYRAREVLMLVDTGAQISMIDQDLARELKIEHISDVGIVGVTGMARGWIGRVRRLQIGNQRVHNLNVMVGPMQGMRLLGMDVLHRLQLTVGISALEPAD